MNILQKYLVATVFLHLQLMPLKAFSNEFRKSEIFEILRNIPISTGCKKINEFWKECSWQSKKEVITGFRIEEQFLDDPGNKIIVNGDFNASNGNLQIEINGIRYPLAEGQFRQEFPLASSAPHLDINFVSDRSLERVPADYLDYVYSVELVLRSDQYTANIVKEANKNVENAKKLIANFERERSFVRYLNLSKPTLLEIRSVISGRQLDDFSDDCFRDSLGNVSELSPTDCELMRHLNRVINGHPPNFTLETLDHIYVEILKIRDKLAEFKHYLELASQEYYSEISEVLARISRLKISD